MSNGLWEALGPYNMLCGEKWRITGPDEDECAKHDPALCFADNKCRIPTVS